MLKILRCCTPRRAYTYSGLVLALVLYACANVVAPTGGPRDEDPPEVIRSTPPNHSTNFRGGRIRIFFNEFIELRNIRQQLLISPPLEQVPEVSIRGRSIVMDIEEELRPNTTYNFFFGDAIRDITEGNAIPNFQFVFSTGDYVDSLSVRGQVNNAFNLKPEEGVYVMLYSNVYDSVPYLERPVYLAKTDKNGQFSISNMAGGEYLIFALDDRNNNFLYDMPGERIAFLDSLVRPEYIPALRRDPGKHDEEADGEEGGQTPAETDAEREDVVRDEVDADSEDAVRDEAEADGEDVDADSEDAVRDEAEADLEDVVWDEAEADGEEGGQTPAETDAEREDVVRDEVDVDSEDVVRDEVNADREGFIRERGGLGQEIAWQAEQEQLSGPHRDLEDGLSGEGAEDLTIRHYQLFMFEEKDTLQRVVSSALLREGLIQIAFRIPFDSAHVREIRHDLEEPWHIAEFGTSRDTLKLWFADLGLDSLHLEVWDGDRVLDTIRRATRPRRTRERSEEGEEVFLNIGFNFRRPAAVPFFRPLAITSEHPLQELDTARIELYIHDSIPIPADFQFADHVRRRVELKSTLEEETRYRINILPGAFTDIFGLTNDTLATRLATTSRENYGNFILRLDLPPADIQYILQLLDRNEVVLDEKVLREPGIYTFRHLGAGTYRARLIEDLRGSGRWDTGNYLRKLQPEPVHMLPDTIRIRENWDVELPWVISPSGGTSGLPIEP